MPAKPTRLTDDLWLAAHDSVNGKPRIGDWPLGVGLAAGLLAELIHDGYLELRQGELFRKTARLPDDIALKPLLFQMEAEEGDLQPPAPPVRARAHVQATPQNRQAWPRPEDDDWSNWLPPERDNLAGPPPPPPPAPAPAPAPALRRHRLPGHQLNSWIAYLAYEQRGEELVARRLARRGLAKRQERRRLFGGTNAWYVPFNSYIAGTPANAISTAVQRGLRLSTSDVFLAGLLFVTALHHDALALLTPDQRALLADHIQGLDDESRELLQAADIAVGEAAMR